MNRFCSLLVLVSLPFTSQAAPPLAASDQAEVQANRSASASSRFRHPVEGEVPDRIALRWMAKIAAEKHEFAAALVMRETGDDIDAANRLVAYLAELHGNLMSERRDVEARVACSPDRGQPTEDEVYRLLDLVDDVQAVIDEKYLVLAQADIGAEKLRPLLDDLKLGISSSVIPSKNAYKNAPPSAAINDLMAFCEARRI